MLNVKPPSPSVAPSLCAALACALLGATVVTGCQGRDPLVARNDDATVTPPPPPHVRALQHKKLFGTMPVDNRFQDPLVTFTGTGWYGFSNDFRSYGDIERVVAPSPTQTPFLLMSKSGNPQGATVIGQLKSSTKPLHVEVWLGRAGEDGNFDHADAEFAGLFVEGGEQTVPLAADESSRTVIDGRTWERFTADLAEGAVGWAALLVTDNAPSADTRESLFVGGPVAVDVPGDAGAALVSSPKRALTVHERALLDALRERTRTLAAPKAPRPSPLPAVAR